MHCSAGIGRTGCFIGVSVGVRQLLEEGAVDVLAIVCQMRLDRWVKKFSASEAFHLTTTFLPDKCSGIKEKILIIKQKINFRLSQ